MNDRQMCERFRELLWSSRLAVALLTLSALLVPSTYHIAPVQAGRPGFSSELDHRFGVVEAWRQPTDASNLAVGWERLTLWWKALQPNGPSDWNGFATENDAYIDSEIASGRQLVGELVNTPDWAAADPTKHGNSIPKGLYLPYDDPNNYWGNFVGMIAKHYAGRIDQWVIWNEVNIPSGKYATWDGSVQDYAQLVRVAYQAARAVNPDSQIILYGDPYWYDHGAFFRRLLAVLASEPGAAANNDYFDAINLHLYNRPSDYIKVVGLYRKWLADRGLDKPVWIGETNAVPYNDPVRRYPKSGFFSTLDDQASYIVDVFALGLALDLQRMEVNRMIDGTDFRAGGEPFGLVRNNQTKRPEYNAYKLVTALFTGVTGGTIRSDSRTGVYEVDLKKAGATIAVLWNQKPQPTTVAIPALSSPATVYDKFGDSWQVSAQSGKYHFTLDPATDNSNPADRRDYVVGGSPVILVQPN
jgi:hypothetical protein